MTDDAPQVDTIGTETVPFLGAEFHVAERVGSMPLMRYAKLAKRGVSSRGFEGLAAMYDLVEQCIHPDDWDRFQQHATDEHADDEQLLQFVAQVMGVVTSRPRQRSSDSSAGPHITEPSSTVASSLPDTGAERVIHRLNEQGRPDLASIVRRRQELLSA